MTSLDQLSPHLPEMRTLVARHRACNPRLFGSVLRGEARAESDIDILVDVQPGATLFDLGGLQEALQALFGRRVDLVTPNDLSARVRAEILAEAAPL